MSKGSSTRAAEPIISRGQVLAHRIIPVSPDQLFLDEENPRLSSSAAVTSQEELLKVLWTEMAVNEVAISIAANGFFEEEPLFVIPRGIPRPDGKQQYTVMEGNRRLAAVKLLRDERLRNRLRATDLPAMRPDRASTIEQLPVSVYAHRKDLWQYFGFRHINGPKAWDAYSKALYVAKVNQEYGVAVRQIAESIGDENYTVERFYRGYCLLQQAEEQTGFSKDDRVANRFNFSHLYTAASQPEFQRFLGITKENSLQKNPVPKKHLPQLRELLEWLYGNRAEGKQPVVRTQAPDLNYLRAVVSAPIALSALRRGYPLERAHEISVGDTNRFREALTSAKEELLQAKATVTTGYDGESDLFHVAEDILEVAHALTEEMRRRTNKPRKDGGR
jgi:hypothetical protein